MRSFPGRRRRAARVGGGYGPKALRTAGRIADGVILQFADPDLIAWCMGFVREGAREAGRDPAKIEVMAAAPVWVSDDLAAARERVRWFPAMVSNHVVDLIAKYKPEELPEGAHLVRPRPREVRLSAPCGSRQRQCEFCLR